MILSLSYRGVFRQEQYETATVEGSITVDTAFELQGLAPEAVMRMLNEQLDALVAPKITEAAGISRYGSDETAIYEWKRIIDATSDETAVRQPKRRVRHRD